MIGQKKKKIKITDLAKKINLSVSSVSRALNGHKNISEKTRDKILKLSKKYNLSIDISGLPSLAKFNFKSKNAQAYKTFITQEMLGHKFLAGNVVFLSTSHNEKILKKYSEHLDEIFYKISECEKGNLNISNILKYPVSHSQFGRLN